MEAPKISVITPMYNRKHYIEQAVDSVLNQTFQDFELIIRDDGSTDGSADFVAERYAEQISSGKIKLRHNEKNLGQFPTNNRLLREATGKYIMMLHSDDLFLPHALEHMYTVAEENHADVVYESQYFATSANIINKDTPLKIKQYGKYQVEKVTIMPNDLNIRFKHWLNGGIGVDFQHNICNRQFLIENELCFETKFGGNRFLSLKLIMRAKVFVKTPEPVYVYRNSPDAMRHSKVSPELVAQFISDQIELSRHLKKYFDTDEFFRDNKKSQYLASSRLFSALDRHWIKRRSLYKNGVSLELNQAVEEAFKKHFGEEATFPAFLFHWVNVQQEKVPLIKVFTPPPQVDIVAQKT